MNKIPNEPTLFVNTVSDKKESNENQVYFDSRKTVRKKVARYRLEDINAMLLYKINILCEISTKTTIYEGVVISVDDQELIISIDNNHIKIAINEIEDINILRL